MKTLFLSLLVVASLVSCGKDNKVESSAQAGPTTSPITATVAGASALGSKIDNYTTQFGTGSITYYGYPQTYGGLVNQAMNLVYRYTKASAAASASGSNCQLKWSIIYVCSYSNTTTNFSSVTESRKVYNNSVDVLSKQNELKAIINSANPLLPIENNGYSYKITTKEGKQFVIDTRYPIQANPIGIKDSAGTEYLFNITEN